MISQLPLLLA
uniref:Uncharacterized protein n=1 Tax=Arundo donax TaxID=35708 RepID=A0A0A8ZU33_ARUDO